ncbi:MAG: P-II family nitrogen regulator [Vitreoscilla sp.]|jgi:nitrogen regulatory protein P-II 1|nr:P-II family nitrogen regulator [Vitreoscilla sp.]
MKEIKAYVHRSRVADVIAALKASPAWAAAVKASRHNLAVYMVKGSLLPLDDEERHYSLDLGDEVVNEYKLELLCEDTEVEELVQAICRAAHTGLAHSGLVTVTTLDQAISIP